MGLEGSGTPGGLGDLGGLEGRLVELAVIDPAPRDASVVAATPVELMVLGRRRFWTTVEASPSLMRKLMIGLARRLHEADRREIDLRKSSSLTDA